MTFNLGLRLNSDDYLNFIFYFRLMGTIPGPIFFGYIIDQVCLLKDGNCLFYDNYSMAISMGIATVIVKIFGVGFFGLAYYFSERSPILDENLDLDVIH